MRDEVVAVAAQELVESVFAEDTVYLDALPERIESAIVTPLSMLADALDRGNDDEVLAAARLVRRCVEPLPADAPDGLRRLVERLPPPAR